jgi:hypothetical protein
MRGGDAMVTEQKSVQKETLLGEARKAQANGNLQRAVELYEKLVSDFEDTDEARQAQEILSMLRLQTSREEIGILSFLAIVPIGLGFWGLIVTGVAKILGSEWA